ncbi:hypothetical protein M8C21_008405, partial [Ambrosia artemisiifolia]
MAQTGVQLTPLRRVEQNNHQISNISSTHNRRREKMGDMAPAQPLLLSCLLTIRPSVVGLDLRCQTPKIGDEIVEEGLLSHHQQQPQQVEINNIPLASQPNTTRRKPDPSLVDGPRENYLKIGVPLYEASIRCNRKVVKAILDKQPELVRYSITDHGETVLHVAASAKGDPKDVKEFVKYLVGEMDIEDLALQNENSNTALYLAAAAGNLETVKIMVEKNRILLTIPGAKGMLPLYAAVLFGNYDVAKYLYENSKELCGDDGWTDQNRGWLLHKCVENDMFDIALEIVKKYPTVGSGSVLSVLARKPEAFHETQSNFLEKAINFSKHLCSLMFTTNQPCEDNHPKDGNGSAPKDTHMDASEGSAPESNHLDASEGSAPEDNHLEVGNGSDPEDNHLKAGNGSALEDYHMDARSGNAPEDNQLDDGNRSALVDLTQKPVASPETKSNSIWKTIKSVFACIGSKVGTPQKESNALLLLRVIWGDIAKKPKNKIDEILRGPADSVKRDNKTVSGWAIQAMQLQQLITQHVDRMEVETKTKNPVELQNNIFKHLVEMDADTQKIIKGAPNSIEEDNQSISSNGEALELQNLIFRHIVDMHGETQKIMKRKISPEDQVSALQKLIFEHIEKMRKDTEKIITKPRSEKKTYSSRVLFIAAEVGNTNFLIELIRQYPDLIWKVNDDNQTIFHIAVKHRHEGIYNLLYEIGAMKDLITPLKDSKENNMLHLVGKIVKQKRLEDVSGVALQMQRELLWFHEVWNMIPSSYRERKNKDGLTPHELFRMEHKELVKQGEKWLKGTATRSMVVAALIVTIVFATAFTVPGGYSQTNGMPFFHSKTTFKIFVVADAISLFLSTASILIFLSILTSRYAESDFLESLPKKLISG